MDEPQTCGKGLAEHAAVPARMAALLGAMAENLALHRTALDPHDAVSRPEYDAYTRLAEQYRAHASQLAATADQMAGYRDLPMAAHDHAAMAAPRLLEAFAEFVERERELLVLLQQRVAADEEMLQDVGRGGVSR